MQELAFMYDDHWSPTPEQGESLQLATEQTTETDADEENQEQNMQGRKMHTMGSVKGNRSSSNSSSSSSGKGNYFDPSYFVKPSECHHMLPEGSLTVQVLQKAVGADVDNSHLLGQLRASFSRIVFSFFSCLLCLTISTSFYLLHLLVLVALFPPAWLCCDK